MVKKEIYDGPDMEFNVGLQKYVPKIHANIEKYNENISSKGSNLFVILIILFILLLIIIFLLRKA